MENDTIQKTENYLRGKMPPEERMQFETALKADPELNRQADDMRTFAAGIRHAARSDIRKRVEALRDQIKREEAEDGVPPKKSPSKWIKSAIMVLLGMLLGLALGWLLFHKEAPKPVPIGISVADTPFDEIARISIPGPQQDKPIPLTILYKPALDLPNQSARTYAFFGERGGLCIYARKGDDFWKQSLELVQSGNQYFLKIGADMFLIHDDGKEHPFPDEPSSR